MAAESASEVSEGLYQWRGFILSTDLALQDLARQEILPEPEMG